MGNMDANGCCISCGREERLLRDREARERFDRAFVKRLLRLNDRLNGKPTETQRIVVDPFVLNNGLPADFGPQPGD